jgi:hypothetical protein
MAPRLTVDYPLFITNCKYVFVYCPLYYQFQLHPLFTL